MKILFVCSGNSRNGISPIIVNQARSLEGEKISVNFYTISGKGLSGYLNNINSLKRYIKKGRFDIIHAHYSLSGFVASLAGAKPSVVSLMGSDVKETDWYKLILKFFNKFFWDICIVKSEDMKKSLGIKGVDIIPNGVDINKFQPMNKNDAIEKLKWAKDKKHILFAANPSRQEKNFDLANKAMQLLNDKNTELHYLNNIDNDNMPFYYNASDLILLTSIWEGSPNVIKEAMACNRPIVTTEVGDVRWVIGTTPGCYISPFDAKELTIRIRGVLDFSERYRETEGRIRILELGLTSEKIAEKLINIYTSLMKE